MGKKFDSPTFRPLTEQQRKLDDPAVKHALRVLWSKGITIQQIEKAYRYYERLTQARRTNGSV